MVLSRCRARNPPVPKLVAITMRPFSTAPGEVADRRQQQQNAENVGDEAGNDEQDRRQHDHGAMRELAAWITSGVHFGTDPGHDAEPLVPQQQRAGDARSQHQADRRQGADLAADNDETGDLQQRKREDEQGKQRNAQILTDRFDVLPARRAIAAGTEPFR